MVMASVPLEEVKIPMNLIIKKIEEILRKEIDNHKNTV
jgi:hypothetical protein